MHLVPCPLPAAPPPLPLLRLLLLRSAPGKAVL